MNTFVLTIKQIYKAEIFVLVQLKFNLRFLNLSLSKKKNYKDFLATIIKLFKEKTKHIKCCCLICITYTNLFPIFAV